jgi:hypothetical protein
VSARREKFANEDVDHLQQPQGWPRDPYKGLNYFTAADAPLFGQRENEINDVMRLLFGFDSKVLLLHGCSGTGKSSFLRAGLCPHLQHLPLEAGREVFFLPGSLSGESAEDPLLIRATGDPVGRIYDILRRAGQTESGVLSEKARQAVRDALSGDMPRDRLQAIPPILTALRAITAPPQRGTFILLVDQAEEVLTLMTTGDAENRRKAFFALIEQICFRLRKMDLRVIVALRTEYYGRFCSFFRIRPRTGLTPDTEIGSGLFDYLLRPLDESHIAAAIRLPTTLRDDSKQAYGFSYQEDLPETIAADLVKQSGETSTLPAMQIVCKQLYERVVVQGKRAQITEQDYRDFGRAAGAIDAFLERALRKAGEEAKLPPLQQTDIDTWALVLWQVVGRSEGGTVQTLIANERELLKQAQERGVAENSARAMLARMADPGRRLLRAAGGEGGKPAYSLGHDSLGPSVLRRAGQAAVRAEEEKKQARYRMSLYAAVAVSCLFLVLALAAFVQSRVLPLRQQVNTLTTYAAKDQSADFRLKLLLGVAALRRADTPLGHWFVDSNESRDALRGVLLRSPVFGGTFEAAAWDADGERVLRLEENKVVIRNLVTGNETESQLPEEKPGTPTSVGLTDDRDDPVRALRMPTLTPIVGPEGAALTPSPGLKLPEELDQEKGLFFPRADIFGKHFRLIAINFRASAIEKMWVFSLSGSKGTPFKLDYPANKLPRLDWDPIERSALRQPVLADDCDAYAFLGRNEAKKGQPPAEDFKVWIGQFAAEKAVSIPIKGLLNAGSVAFARDCKAVVVREDSAKLHIIPLKDSRVVLDEDKKPVRETVSLELVPSEMKEVLLPTVGQTQPMLAAAAMNGGEGWSVAWPTRGGLVRVDIEKRGDQLVISSLSSEQMLTGIDPSYAVGSLGLTRDARIAFLSTQPSFATPVRFRVFDLDHDRQLTKLAALDDDSKLIERACSVAKLQSDTGSNELTPTELQIWLGSGNAPQPCARPKR